MKSLFLSTLLATAALPAVAQSPAAPPEQQLEEGLGLLGEGAQRLLDGLLQSLDPGLQALNESLRDLGPMLNDLARLIGDIQYYAPPERLPNGDILLRRLPGSPPLPALPQEAPAARPNGAIDL